MDHKDTAHQVPIELEVVSLILKFIILGAIFIGLLFGSAIWGIIWILKVILTGNV